MERLYKRWDEPKCLFGDLAVISFFILKRRAKALAITHYPQWRNEAVVSVTMHTVSFFLT